MSMKSVNVTTVDYYQKAIVVLFVFTNAPLLNKFALLRPPVVKLKM